MKEAEWLFNDKFRNFDNLGKNLVKYLLLLNRQINSTGTKLLNEKNPKYINMGKRIRNF